MRSIVIALFIWGVCLASQEKQTVVESWKFAIQAENRPDSSVWRQEFQRAAEELSLVQLQYFDQNLDKFLSGNPDDGWYVFFILGEKNVKILYFFVVQNYPYLLSSIEEAIMGKKLGTLCFQMFRRTYPVHILVKDGRGIGSSESGIMESQVYYLEDYLLGKSLNNQKITTAYIDDGEEEVGFQERGFLDGNYRRAWVDKLGQISLKKSIKFPEDAEQFLVSFYYGWSPQVPNEVRAYSVEEFQELSFRRNLPMTILLSHKRKFYQSLAIQMYVPFQDGVFSPKKIIQLEENLTSFAGTELKGQELQKLHLSRPMLKVQLKAVDDENRELTVPENGEGRIEIFREDSTRVIYRGRSSFRPTRIPNVAVEAGEYIFSYKPFYAQKFIQQRRDIVIGQDMTVTFRPYIRIPYIFYEFQNSIYSNLGTAFSTEELNYRIRSFDTLIQFLDLLEQQKVNPSIIEGFLSTVVEVYEQHEQEIWAQIPSEHPQHIAFYFDMIEIYWRLSVFSSQPVQHLEKALQLLMGNKSTFPEFCKTWYFKENRCMDLKAFSQNLLKEKPGMFSKVRTRWDRYRAIHSLGAILLRYYRNTYQDISEEACATFVATATTLAFGFKMKDERTRALGEEHPGLDYNMAEMIAELLGLTKQRELNNPGWTEQQKLLFGMYLNDSETKHTLYSALSFLEALGEEFKRPERFELQIVPSELRDNIAQNCHTLRRQELENFLNEVLRKWYKKDTRSN